MRKYGNCAESIYMKQKTRTKALPSATVGEQYFSACNFTIILFTSLSLTIFCQIIRFTMYSIVSFTSGVL